MYSVSNYWFTTDVVDELVLQAFIDRIIISTFVDNKGGTLTSERIDKGVLVLDGDIIDIFGFKGFVSGGSWRTNIFLGIPLGIGFPFGGTPCPVSPEIECVIAEDVAGESQEKIDHLIVAPGIAVRLFLEGKITPQHVRSAEVRDNQTILFCGIRFASRLFNVLVSQTEAPNVTINREGLVV